MDFCRFTLFKNMYPLFLTLLTLLPLTLSQLRRDCSRESYNRCVGLADPLLREPHLVFPDNMQDIELVCLTWNQFVDCLKAYTDRCFTPMQKKQFNKAVENPIESVHQMCTQRNYQREYLQHASCIKSTVTQRQHCGNHYTMLVQQVQQGDAISRASLCCSHDKFKRCVMKEARKICDKGNNNGQALRFASQIIDKALSFLQDQCFNYIPNSGDCAAQRKNGDDIMTMSTASWGASTRSGGDLTSLSTGVSPLEIGISNPIPSIQGDAVRVTDTVNWATSDEAATTWKKETVTREPQENVLGSRTRPSSYGRSSGWDTSPPSTTSSWATTTLPPEIQNKIEDTPNRTPDWATISTWHATNQDRKITQEPTTNSRTTTETWYPAAGSHVGTKVDEPNQLGLSKPKHSGEGRKLVHLSLILVATLVILI